MTPARLLGRITYTTIYVFLCFVLALLLLIVPADIVRQVLRHTFQQANVLVLAIVYVFTLIVVTFVYVLRLYTTRAVLASISVPRPRIPVFEKGDGVKVNADVRAVIRASLSRSAAIAWAARPKVIPREAGAGAGGLETVVESDHAAGEISGDDELRRNGAEDCDDSRKTSCLRLFSCFRSNKKKQAKKTTTAADQMGIALPPVRPVWGHIEHDGWESPDSPDLPNLQYSTVLAELPNLIEAKAVSLAPPLDAESVPTSNNPPQTQTLDPEAVMLLQRALNMSMRDYVGHLTGLGVLPSDDDDSREQQQQVVSEFLDVYERARFSTRPMSGAHFRNLMHLFAEVLRAMRPPQPEVLYGYGFEDEADDDAVGRSYYNDYDRASANSISLSLSQSESDGQHIDDDAPRDGTPTTPAHSIASGSLVRLDSRSSSNSVRSSNASQHSQRRPRPPPHPHSLQPPHNGHRDSIYSYSYRDRNSSANTGHRYRTAPTTPMSRRQFDGGGGGRASEESSESLDAFARRAGRPYYAAGSPPSSSASLRSRRRSEASGGSAGSQSQGSVVIRLTRPEDRDARGLPYVLRVGDE
ncbi:hypothetical protein DL764_001135 [Monosporascus ibericus]|uniref:Defect at low temperature protein 1 n=1 Tax=Monosporascus ibericus TaxID=155417 RepID=A0A4V1XCG9_9PEZI|nr:hypothetical protein DL764_001135 [Monosporascus ibericus]